MSLERIEATHGERPGFSAEILANDAAIAAAVPPKTDASAHAQPLRAEYALATGATLHLPELTAWHAAEAERARAIANNWRTAAEAAAAPRDGGPAQPVAAVRYLDCAALASREADFHAAAAALCRCSLAPARP